MSKMSILEAAEFFGVSKEAIHNRIRRGSLESFIEDGIKYVIVNKEQTLKPKVKIQKPTTAFDEKYYQLLEEQNSYLQKKLEKQEDEIRLLREQKEQLLIQERIKIEQIYKDKDEQLKNILNSFKEQMLLTNKTDSSDTSFDAEIIEPIKKKKSKKKLTSLKKFLEKKYKDPKKIDKIKKRFKKIAKDDKRVIIIDKKLYVDTSKYSYDDLV